METESNLCIIWLDETFVDSKLTSKIIEIQDELRSTVDKDLKFFNNAEQCEEFIRSQPLVRNIVLLVDSVAEEWMIERAQYIYQIICTFTIEAAPNNQASMKQNLLRKVKFSTNLRIMILLSVFETVF